MHKPNWKLISAFLFGLFAAGILLQQTQHSRAVAAAPQSRQQAAPSEIFKQQDAPLPKGLAPDAMPMANLPPATGSPRPSFKSAKDIADPVAIDDRAKFKEEVELRLVQAQATCAAADDRFRELSTALAGDGLSPHPRLRAANEKMRASLLYAERLMAEDKWDRVREQIRAAEEWAKQLTQD